MKCNNCGNVMIIGKTSISASVGGFLIFGLSYKNLVFNSDNNPIIKIQGNSESKTAYYCKNCESVFIQISRQKPPIKIGEYTYEVEEGDDLTKIVP